MLTCMCTLVFFSNFKFSFKFIGCWGVEVYFKIITKSKDVHIKTECAKIMLL